MSDIEHPQDPDIRTAELTAYLDGELSEEQASQVEQRLASDSAYRDELHSLQGVWDALDALPQVHADAHFARTTIEMVAAKASEDVQKKTAAEGTRWVQWMIGVVAAVLLCFGVSYAAVMAVSQRENQRLAEDLPMLEQIDVYEQVDSIEILEMLDARGLFGGENSNEI